MQDATLNPILKILNAPLAIDGEEREDNHHDKKSLPFIPTQLSDKKYRRSFEYEISLINTDQGVAIQIDAPVFAMVNRALTELELMDHYTITVESNTTRIHGNIEKLAELLSLLNHNLQWISPKKNIELDGQLLFHFAKKKSDPINIESILFSSKGKTHVMNIMCLTKEKARKLCHEIFLGKFEKTQSANNDYKVGSTGNTVIMRGPKKTIKHAIIQLYETNKCIDQESANELLARLEGKQTQPAPTQSAEMKIV